MKIEVEKEEGVVVLSPVGRLDATNGPKVEEHIWKIFDEGTNRFVVDMTGVEYISSLGLSVFLKAAKRARSEDGRIALAALQDTVTHVFEISGFHTLFDTFETRAQAVDAMRDGGAHADAR